MKHSHEFLFCVILVLNAVCGLVEQNTFEQLKQWLVSQGATVNQGLQIHSFQHGGNNVRGLQTTAALSNQAILMEVPKGLWLAVSNIPTIAESPLPEACAWQKSPSSDALKLAAAAALEFQKGASSFWHPYLKQLPSMNDYDTFLPVRMDGTLQSDFAALNFLNGFETARKDVKKQQECFEAWSKQANSPVSSLSWQEMLLAVIWVQTRAFGIKVDYEGTPLDGQALIPGFDLLNTEDNDHINAVYTIDPQASATYELFPTLSVTPGSELIGPYCMSCNNSGLVGQYGLYLEYNSNPVGYNAEVCSGEAGLRMKGVTQAAVQPSSGWMRSPRCRESVLGLSQGPLRCSLARLAWEACADDWGVVALSTMKSATKHALDEARVSTPSNATHSRHSPRHSLRASKRSLGA